MSKHSPQRVADPGSAEAMQERPVSSHQQPLFSPARAADGRDISASRGELPRTETPLPDSAARTMERIDSLGRLVEMAALKRKSDAHHMNLVLQSTRFGRVSLRMVERAGTIDTLVRTDSGRASQLFSESLPALMESLSQRGLHAEMTGPFDYSGRGSGQERGSGRQRHPQPNQRGTRRGRGPAFRVAAR